jgi:hypothetical protein
MEHHHYLTYEQPVGERLKYLAWAQGRPIACLAWSSARLHLGSRDRYIGWSAEARRQEIARRLQVGSEKHQIFQLGLLAHRKPLTARYVSRNAGAVVHCAPGARQSQIRQLEGTETGSDGSQGDLPGGDGRAGGAGTERVHGQMGTPVSSHRPDLERQLGAGDPVFRISARGSPVVYTTNAVESLHMSLRKIINARGSFPSEEAALKWDTVQHWRQALNHFQMIWGDRIQAALNR